MLLLLLRFVAIHAVLLASRCDAMRCDEVQFFAFGSLIDWRKISAFINNNNFYSPFAAAALVVVVVARV